jgi:hypothetical protein
VLRNASDESLVQLLSEPLYRRAVLPELGGLRPRQFGKVRVTVPGEGFRQYAYLRLSHGRPLARVPASTGSLLTSLVQNTPVPRAEALAPTLEPDSEEEPLASGVRGLVDGVREALADGAVGQADRLTTLALMEQAGREGCLRRADAEKIPDRLLAELDDGWASTSGGWWGFRAQRARLAALVLSGRRPLRDICLALGWRTGLDDVVPLYAEFVRNAKDGATPFYPTLRNTDREHDPQWHDEWATTVLALHKRLRDWGG